MEEYFERQKYMETKLLQQFTKIITLGKPSKKNCVFYDIVIIRETTYPPSLIRT